MNTKRIFLALTITLLITGCIKKAKIDLPKSENKLVVTCFISPQDSVITAIVNLSTPKFWVDPSTFIRGNQLEASDVQNATVILSNGVKQVTLPFDRDSYIYKISARLFRVEEGSTYSLSVSTPDGKWAHASTTLPTGKLSLETSELMAGINSQGDRQYDFNLSVNDLPGQVNYVIVSSQLVSAMFARFPTPHIDTLIQVKSKYDIVDTDERSVKTKYEGGTGFFIRTTNTDSLVSANIRFATLNCSRDFFLYNKSVTEAVEKGVDNPFGDPVFIYSNITNGLGCFGGYVGAFSAKKIK